MKVFHNILSENTLSLITKDREKNLATYKWGVAGIGWNPVAFDGAFGTLYMSLVDKGLQDIVLQEISKCLPSYKKLFMCHYIWDCGSGLAMHSDTQYKYTCTIYLNPSWSLNHGGILLYKDASGKLLGIEPKYNTMMLNEEKEDHLVTPISFKAKDKRYTLQIMCYE